MVEVRYDNLNETIHRYDLDNGMKVMIDPKPGFNSTYGILNVHFGAINNVRLNGDQLQGMPLGIAHFLEHKMFDKHDYDSSDRFGKFGSDSNAFTSFDQTSYLFNTTSHVNDNLDVLIDLVQHPYFDEKKVQKEQGIIGQEILMYQDDPSSRIYFNTIGNLYHGSPLDHDIAGTVDSIAEITADDLYAMYRQYYVPNNMDLMLVGKVDKDQAIARISDLEKAIKPINPTQIATLKQKTNEAIQKSPIVASDYSEMNLSTGKVAVGFRGPSDQVYGSQFSKNELSLGLFLSMIFSEDSESYQRLYSEGIINDSFGYDFDMEAGYQFVIFAEDSDHPELFQQSIKREIKRALDDASGLTKIFNLIKREEIGQSISVMNSNSAIANQMGDPLNEYTNIFDEVQILNQLSLSEVIDFAKHFFDFGKTTLKVIS